MHCRLHALSRAVCYAVSILLLLVSFPLAIARAQNANPPPSVAPPAKTAPAPPVRTGKTGKRRASRSTTKSANVKTGTITAIDASAGTVSIQERAGQKDTFDTSENTRCWKARKTAELADFKPGDVVVVHLRRSRSTGEQTVDQMLDNASWDWLQSLRKNTTVGSITALEDDALAANVGDENLPMTYRLSDTTYWMRAGKPCAATDFHVGDKVYIVPRSLPSGGILARVVSDQPDGAAQGKERQARSVSGNIQILDAALSTLTLHTDAGDTRTLLLTAQTEVRRGSKPLPRSVLRVGQHVRVRVTHDDKDQEIAARVTLEAAKKRPPLAGAKSKRASKIR